MSVDEKDIYTEKARKVEVKKHWCKVHINISSRNTVGVLTLHERSVSEDVPKVYRKWSEDVPCLHRNYNGCWPVIIGKKSISFSSKKSNVVLIQKGGVQNTPQVILKLIKRTWWGINKIKYFSVKINHCIFY